jgi:hypothetical protein
MLLKKIKTLIVGLAVLISMNAEAKVEQFQDSFTGYLDRSTRNDAIWYSGQSTFISNNVSLTTTYDLFDDDFSFFIVAGTFERDDGNRKFSGYFDINLYSADPSIWPDPWQFPGIPYEIIGNFQYDHSIYSPITGERVINDYGFGLLKGFMTNQQYLTFTIDWVTVNGAVVSSVPTPPTVWMFSSGLLLLGVMLSKRASPKLHHSLLLITKG